MRRCEVRFLPENVQMTVAEGTSLLQAAREAGLTVEAPCDGKGSCGKCRVRVTGTVSLPEPFEKSQLGAVGEDIRLACRARVYGFAQAEILPTTADTFAVLAEGENGGRAFDPSVREVDVNAETVEDGCGQTAIAGMTEPLFCDAYPVLLRELAEEYGGEAAGLRAIVKDGKLLDWRRRGERPLCGIALDIGTTSVVVELLDLASGQSMGTCSCLNPQTEFGGDVLTRIAYTMQHSDGTARLQQKIAACINRLISQLTAAAKVGKEDIYEVVVAGNTTMQHLLLGVPPRSLAQAPYRPVFTRQVEVSAATAGIDIAPRGVVAVLPSASAFVGADIMAGLTALGLQNSPKKVLFIDIGTNGEIVVGQGGALVGTSSAAGPALEGMNITCGCRAENGAVEAASVLDDGTIDLTVIGGGPIRGVCGSGLIDLVAELVRHRVIDAGGRFAKKEMLTPALARRLMNINGKPAFHLSEDGTIYLSQKDVRQVQLAKGAIAAAVGLLLKDLSIGYADIEEILIAGAFGFHLKTASLVGIGLLPPECQEKIRFVGNTAKEGAKAALLDRGARRQMRELAQTIQIRELSLHSEFQKHYVESLGFPRL